MDAKTTLILIGAPWVVFFMWRLTRPSVRTLIARIAMLENEAGKLRERVGKLESAEHAP